MKYLTVIYNGNAFRWLFLQIKTVQILLQFVLSLIFPIYANFTNYCANLNLYAPPTKAKLTLSFENESSASPDLLFLFISSQLEEGISNMYVCVDYIYLCLQLFP